MVRTGWRRLALAVLVGALAPALAEAAAPAGQWWSASYRYRQKLSLTSGTTAIPTQYSVRHQLDHAALVSVSQSLASGDDVRVAWWSGTAWVELDRLLDDQSAWNSAATQIWFRTQAAIGASSTDDNYYLYYGNSVAAAPPANWPNVFLFYDDFNDGALDAARWVCTDPGSATPPAVCTESAVAPGTLSLESDSAVYAAAAHAFGVDTRWESRLRLATNLPAGPDFYNYFGASDLVNLTNPYQSDWATFWASQFQHETEASNNLNKDSAPGAVATPTSFHVYTFDREGSAGVRFFQDGTQLRLASVPITIPNASLRVVSWNDGATANGVVLDWVRVRKYVTPEPSFTPAAAEIGPSGMRVISGTYTGNGVNNRPVFVGFRPEAVFVDRYDPALPGPFGDEAVLATSTMPAGLSKFLDAGSGAALAGNAVVSLDAQGFTLGTHNNVNQNGITYYWVAFRGAPGELRLGTYLGAPAAQDVTSVGFSPAYVVVLSEALDRTLQKTSAMPATFSLDFNGTGYTDAILNLLPDGFRVGNDANVNTNGTTYHYLAWAPVPGKVAVGSYTGGLPDGTDITGTGFWPEWVVIGRSNNAAGPQGNVAVHKPASSGVGADFAVLFDGTNAVNNNIQNLQADGFQIGGHARVNSAVAPNIYHWVAFGPHTPATNYRSIGNTGVTYGTSGTAGAGTRVSVTNGSASVAGLLGTAWRASNRGRGDVITIPCDNPPTCTLPTPGVHYTILSVASDSSLLLSQDYQGTDDPSASYLIRRQFATLSAWEDCIDGPPGTACPYFPVLSSSLVADDRREVGIAYKDSVFGLAATFSILDSTTDATHTITLTADGINRHNGVVGAGVVVDAQLGPNEIIVRDANVTIEWLELRGLRGADNNGQIRVLNSGATNVLLQNLLIHDYYEPTATINQVGIRLSGTAGKSVTIRNVMIWDGDQIGIAADEPGDILVIENCSIDDMRDAAGSPRRGVFADTTPGVIVRNTIATRSGTDFATGSGSFAPGPASTHNVSSDATAPGANPLSALASSLFVNPGVDLHLMAGAVAIDSGADLSASFRIDVDGGVRPSGPAWDRGADEFGATTAVRLQSFAATAGDGSVVLEWRTASELDNLGFHVFRALAENGPWTRLTASLIPGLGSSALGQAYSFRDAGLVNGTRYYYRLLDVDASSKSTSHGPVSAVPAAATSGGSRTDEEGDPGRKRRGEATGCPDWVFAAYASATGADASAARLGCTRHGHPEAVSLEEVSRDSRQATLELRTGGFYALHQPSGQVRVYVPGFDYPREAESAALPMRRALVEAVVGRRVLLGSVRALELSRFSGFEPSLVGKSEMQVSLDGTVRAARRDGGAVRGLRVNDLARLMPSVFQGETKSAVVQISPLRYDQRSRTLTLAHRVRVSVLFTGRETGERGRESRGRRAPRPTRVSGEVLARLYTTDRGLQAITFEELFPGRPRGFATSELRLQRQGQPVAFHVEPASASFGPASQLFFFAEAAAGSSAYSAETAWELVRSVDGLQMPLETAAPTGDAVRSASTGRAAFEVNRIYQPGLLEAPDLWLWDAVASGATRLQPFALAGVDPSAAESATLELYLQGGSESGQAVDHHVSVSLGGVPVGETRFAGKRPHRLSLSLPVALLHDGTNELALTNVGDTGVASMVFLDRFTLAYPQLASLAGGAFEGSWSASGTAAVAGAASSPILLDVTAADGPAASGPVRWLCGFESTGGSLRFHVGAGQRYRVVSREALRKPRVAFAGASTLRSATSQADYLLIAPRAFLPAAAPLVARRRDQGLAVRAVAFEEIATEFGHGQPSAEAVRNFLAYAFHSWAQPSPRYVLLLGDASYDPRRFVASSQPSPLPALWSKTSYLWTVSDPQLAAVNGEDELPDLAIGRLPATTVEQAQALVDKLVAWEESGQGLSGPAALVADNPDLAGDFEQNAHDIATSFLAERSELLLLRELGAGTRPRIQAALDSGLSFLSYVGHGGAAVWASENVWNSWDAPSLLAQSRQPLLLTLNCLNGYFVAPSFDSLSESLLKAEGRGAIAAFSPSGLSLDGPAHQYHRALMQELTSGQHERLGDALVAAQKAYAQSGLMPELLSIYHLLGDPAMRIR